MGGVDTSDESRFAESAKELRERNGWSQGELARRMVEEGWETYSQMTVSRTEKHERPIRLGEARALARVLGSDVNLMVGYRSPDNEQSAVALLRSVSSDLRRAVDRLFTDQVDAMEQVAKAVAVVADIDEARPLSTPELDQIADRCIDDIRRMVDWVNAMTQNLNDQWRSETPVVDRTTEPDDVFEREVLMLFEVFDGEPEAAS